MPRFTTTLGVLFGATLLFTTASGQESGRALKRLVGATSADSAGGAVSAVMPGGPAEKAGLNRGDTQIDPQANADGVPMPGAMAPGDLIWEAPRIQTGPQNKQEALRFAGKLDRESLLNRMNREAVEKARSAPEMTQKEIQDLITRAREVIRRHKARGPLSPPIKMIEELANDLEERHKK